MHKSLKTEQLQVKTSGGSTKEVPNLFSVGTVQFNNKKMRVYIADTHYLRVRGLSGVSKLKQSTGMLFIFPYPKYVTMTNLNVRIPLDLAFIDRNYIVREIISMEPHEMGSNPKSYRSQVRYNFVVEANQGFFKRNGIKINSQFFILDV